MQKNVYELEREQGRVSGRSLREERIERYVKIIISSKIEKIKYTSKIEMPCRTDHAYNPSILTLVQCVFEVKIVYILRHWLNIYIKKNNK